MPEIHPKIAYSAIVLDDKSRNKLIKYFQNIIPENWEVIAHHMTINMGEILPEYEKFLGMPIRLNIISIGKSDKALAIEVQGGFSTNPIHHITLAIDRKNGAKPYDSNKITNWKHFEGNLMLVGKVTEVPVNI